MDGWGTEMKPCIHPSMELMRESPPPYKTNWPSDKHPGFTQENNNMTDLDDSSVSPCFVVVHLSTRFPCTRCPPTSPPYSLAASDGPTKEAATAV